MEDRPHPSLSLGMSPINFEDMDSRDIKALFTPLGIPHPPLGHRQTSEYRRILKEWIGVDPGESWLGLQRVQLVKTVIETHRTRPGGPPSAKDRGKKRAARVEAARVTDTRNAFTWCAWQTPQKVLEQKNEDNTDQVSQNVQDQIPTHRNEAFDEAFHTNANNTIASMEPMHPRQHLDRPVHGFDSFEHCPQSHREPVPMYSETAAQVISICIDGQTVCQMPLKTKQSRRQVPMELSVAVSSGQNNKRLKTNLSDMISYERRTSPPENQQYMNCVQPVAQTAAPTQRAHLDDFQNFHTAQNPQIHQPINEFRQIKPANHEIRHLKSMQPAHSQTWETDPTLHIRTFEREVSQIRERQNICSTMRASCHKEARYPRADAYSSERCKNPQQQQQQQQH